MAIMRKEDTDSVICGIVEKLKANMFIDKSRIIGKRYVVECDNSQMLGPLMILELVKELQMGENKKRLEIYDFEGYSNNLYLFCLSIQAAWVD